MLSKYATTVSTDARNLTTVTYHSTAIVRFDARHIVLNSGGWQTVTTKKKMNQSAEQFSLGFRVYQQDFGWYVDFNGLTLDFEDGMVLARVDSYAA